MELLDAFFSLRVLCNIYIIYGNIWKMYSEGIFYINSHLTKGFGENHQEKGEGPRSRERGPVSCDSFGFTSDARVRETHANVTT